MRINISIDDELAEKVDHEARMQGLSRSAFISAMLSQRIGPERYGYAWQRLHSAMLSLTSEGEEWMRIGYAYMEISTLELGDFPPELREDFHKLQAMLQKYSDDEYDSQHNQGGQYDSLMFQAPQRMSDLEKRKVTELFLMLYDHVTRHQRVM